MHKPDHDRRRGLRAAACCFLVAASVAAVYWPVVRNGFVGYDDEEYVIHNPHVNTGLSRGNAWWALTAAHSNNWHPLTWISHQLDCSLFAMAPAGHHAVNLGFHVANTGLLFRWLFAITASIWPSAWVALIFGLHPLHVESVAWVAERKDVLSMFFALMALLAYTAYVRRGGIGRYLMVAVFLAMGLMSKPMLVTLPLVFLVVDFWPLGRGPRILEKVPLLAISGLAALATLWAQSRGGAVAGMEGLPLAARLANATLSYIRYLAKTIWPVDLAVFYPFPLKGIPAWQVAGAAVAIAGISALVFVVRGRRPWLAAGWCWYIVTLLPVIGIVQVGMQSMADRYMYLPMVGLLVGVAWESARLNGRAAAALGLLAAAGCAMLSWRQIPVWKDGVTLFTHALAATRENFVAHNNLGVELDRRGRYEEALAHYREALRIKPGDRNSETNLAQASFAKGERLFNERRFDEALASFREGMRYRPASAAVHANLGQIFLERRDLGRAAAQFRKALEMDASLVSAHVGLGIVYAHAGKDLEAQRCFEEALRLDPSNIEARFDLGLVLAGLGRRAEALHHLDEVLRRKPDYAPAREARAALGVR
jgi:tetratricopeptide (TPR) repeat protein